MSDISPRRRVPPHHETPQLYPKSDQSTTRFSRAALWFADWQGSPAFVAILASAIAGWLALQHTLPLLGLAPFDPNTWYLNLALSMLAAFAASLSVMGAKIQARRAHAEIDYLHRVLDDVHDTLDRLEQKLDAK